MKVGWTELLLILFLVLVLFGSKRLPELARSIGKSIAELKKGLNDVTKDVTENNDEKKPLDPKC